MTSYQYRKSYCGDKTILRPSYLHNGISYTGKMTYLYWIRALQIASQWFSSCWVMYIYIWVRSRNCGCLVTWFCYQLIAKPGNKTATVPWPDPYDAYCQLAVQEAYLIYPFSISCNHKMFRLWYKSHYWTFHYHPPPVKYKLWYTQFRPYLCNQAFVGTEFGHFGKNAVNMSICNECVLIQLLSCKYFVP